MSIERFEQLEVWQKAHALVLQVYKLTEILPVGEKYGLISQMRRAAVAVPANIAEGFKRRGKADKARFYNMADTSLEELRYYFILCRDLGFKLDFHHLNRQATEVGKMSTGLTRSVISDER
ncbi:MAG TPA: four helix bundle protein [Verrucomicrobiae bacterium]|nr:four helix bundle protein [Verrucomicrobiae bacterium]